MAAAKAALAQAEWQLEQRLGKAPAAARRHRHALPRGRVGHAGAPVVELLPPDNVKLRFFVPEPLLGGARRSASR